MLPEELRLTLTVTGRAKRDKYAKVELDGPFSGVFWIYPIDAKGHIIGGPVAKDTNENVINKMVERLNSGDLEIF